MDSLYTFKCKRFRNTPHILTFVKLFLKHAVLIWSCHFTFRARYNTYFNFVGVLKSANLLVHFGFPSQSFFSAKGRQTCVWNITIIIIIIKKQRIMRRRMRNMTIKMEDTMKQKMIFLSGIAPVHGYKENCTAARNIRFPLNRVYKFSCYPEHTRTSSFVQNERSCLLTAWQYGIPNSR
jgi:hypothetical protein